MKKCIDTGLKLYECTEISHSCHFTLYNVANSILYVNILHLIFPWVLYCKDTKSLSGSKKMSPRAECQKYFVYLHFINKQKGNCTI